MLRRALPQTARRRLLCAQRRGQTTLKLDAVAVADMLRSDPDFARQVGRCVDPDTAARIECEASAADTDSCAASVPRPDNQQLRRTAIRSAIPFIGFGVFDNLVMITVGDAIDATFGVTLGFSTLAAAGLGQCCSDACGITLQGFIERFADGLGLPDPKMTRAQERLSFVKTVQQIARTIGIVFGCLIGMFPLLFIHGHHPRVIDQCFGQLPLELRSALQATLSPQKFAQDATLISRGQEVECMYLIQSGTVSVRGPDKDGNLMEICTLGEGSVVGDLEVVNGHKAVADVVAVETTRVQVLPRDDFRRLLGDLSGKEGSAKNLIRDKLHNDTHYCWYRMQNTDSCQ